MTTTQTDTTATALLRGDGTAIVTIAGEHSTVTASDEAEVMREAIKVIAERARELGQPITVQAIDDSGTAVLQVQPNGDVVPVELVPPSPEPEESPVVASRRELRTARDFARSRRPAPPAPAEHGWQGFLNRLSLGRLRLNPGAPEVDARSGKASIQRGLLGHKTVTLANLKGGSSKTTCAYLIGATLGRERGGNLLVWDNNENSGTLGERAIRASHEHTAVDLLEHIDDFVSPANAQHLINYVRPQGENKFHVLASQDEGMSRSVIDGAAFSQLHKVLRNFYHLTIVDTGNASNASTWQAAMEESDEIVIVALNKEDSTTIATSTVDVLVKQGHMDRLARGIVIISEMPVTSAEQRKSAAARLERFREHMLNYLREVIVLPYDPALNEGGEIDYDRLSPATREAYRRATAAIVDGL
ncbi:MinD/ParA family ATP-binding protein [Microbacterium sp.]|uniref:MinD/ParA family ATP-binding protein n=1 Tax=Microbacterium sp. TaxID=51671 RepID=UPI003F986BC9